MSLTPFLLALFLEMALANLASMMNKRSRVMALLRTICLLISIILFLFAVSPLRSSADEGVPKAVLQETVYNFGAVMKGERVTHVFTVRNNGTKDLVFEKAALTEQGMTIKLQKVIPPGGEGRVTLELATDQVQGSIEASALLYTNDPLRPTVQLSLKGRAKGIIDLLPYAAIFISAFKGEVKEGAVNIANNDKKPLQITKVQSESDRFRAQLQSVKEGEEYKLVVKLNPNAPPGRSKDIVRLFTNNEKMPQLNVPVNVFIKNEVYTFPDQVDFGTISR